VLDFDHIDPSAKRKSIHKLVHQAYSWAAIQAEMAKCETRCANCHRLRTAEQFAWQKLAFRRADAPTQLSESARTRRHRPRGSGPHRDRFLCAQDVVQAQAANSRWCPWCGRARPTCDFPLRRRATGERQSICGECLNQYRREHYRLYRTDYIERNSRLLKERGRKWSRRLWEFLLAHSCVDCGETNPIVLEFDHMDRTTKLNHVGSLARAGYPWSTVFAELEKCEVRCANCHRKRTARQFAWPKLVLSPVASGSSPLRSTTTGF
jgi:hypothetical protein